MNGATHWGRCAANSVTFSPARTHRCKISMAADLRFAIVPVEKSESRFLEQQTVLKELCSRKPVVWRLELRVSKSKAVVSILDTLKTEWKKE